MGRRGRRMARELSTGTRKALIVAVAGRYRDSAKGERSRILDEFVELTRYHRKHAIRVLTKRPGSRTLMHYRDSGSGCASPMASKARYASTRWSTPTTGRSSRRHATRCSLRHSTSSMTRSCSTSASIWHRNTGARACAGGRTSLGCSRARPPSVRRGPRWRYQSGAPRANRS